MRVLVVAHPDDEVLWFNPEEFDRIVIVFLGRTDIPAQTEGRRKALEQHPLAERITCLGLTESGYWRDKSKASEYGASYLNLCKFLETLEANEVVTHNAWGEYQHDDHILVHNACMATLKCSVNGKDPAMWRKIRRTYEANGCWTWY